MQNLMQNAIISIAVCAHSMPARAQKTSKTALLPSPSDLRQVAVQAGTRGEPLVLMVSLPGCPWCELLRRNYLAPMRSEGVASADFIGAILDERLATARDRLKTAR
jgi:thioredoxin-related protein